MRVIGLDVSRTVAEIAYLEHGRVHSGGRIGVERDSLRRFAKGLRATDHVVLEATGNTAAIAEALKPFVGRVVIANPLQVRLIAEARIKTDKIDAAVLAQLYASGFLPEVWIADERTQALRRQVARRSQIVRQRTRLKNEIHSVLASHLIPRCPATDLFGKKGRTWLSEQPLPMDERVGVEQRLRELDRLAEDLTVIDRALGVEVLLDTNLKRLLTITGVNATIAIALLAAVGEIGRFASPQKLVSYFGLNPRVHQSGEHPAQHGRISKTGRSHARAMLVEAAWAAAKGPWADALVLSAYPSSPRHADRSSRNCPEARDCRVVCPHRPGGLYVGPPFARGNEGAHLAAPGGLTSQTRPERHCGRLQRESVAGSGTRDGRES